MPELANGKEIAISGCYAASFCESEYSDRYLMQQFAQKKKPCATICMVGLVKIGCPFVFFMSISLA
jgi:hypothetical protein